MKQSFPPIIADDARLLILGSMPGEESLRQQQYYAHPRNAFWYILQRLFCTPQTLTYKQKIDLLQCNSLALWDVLMACKRQGSLDASIDNDSIVVNDFEALFLQQPKISGILFNGAKAEAEYKRRVVPHLSTQFKQIDTFRLPSTSPAMASLTKEQKYLVWSEVIAQLL